MSFVNKKLNRVYIEAGPVSRALSRLIMEEKLGRPLERTEYVHHIDGDSMNDDPGNLMIISAQEHMKLHPRIHAPHTQETKDAISRAHKGNTYHLGHHHSGNTKRVIGQGVSKASEDAWALRRQLYGPSGMRPRVSNQEGR